MKIGYSVEDSTSRALMFGLRQRWCPEADLTEGRFRGSTRQSRRREIEKICLELTSRAVDLIVFLTDSNDDDSNAWRTVLRAETEWLPPRFGHLTVIGVCQRNVECWLCVNPEWIAVRTGRNPSDFRVPDPKGAFESALGVTRADRKEKEIAGLVERAPLREWLTNRSFEDFYKKLWQKSKEMRCAIENLHEQG